MGVKSSPVLKSCIKPYMSIDNHRQSIMYSLNCYIDAEESLIAKVDAKEGVLYGTCSIRLGKLLFECLLRFVLYVQLHCSLILHCL